MPNNVKPMDLTSVASAEHQSQGFSHSVQSDAADDGEDGAKPSTPSRSSGRGAQHTGRGGRRGGRSGKSGRGHRHHLSKQDRNYAAQMAAQQM